jgi:hypothetical protein
MPLKGSEIRKIDHMSLSSDAFVNRRAALGCGTA